MCLCHTATGIALSIQEANAQEANNINQALIASTGKSDANNMKTAPVTSKQVKKEYNQ